MLVDYKLLGSRIKQRRLAKGATQENFAEYMDVSVGYVSQLERGITKISLDRLAVICEYLGCDMGSLLEGVNTGTSDYLNTELDVLYKELSARDKRLLTTLIKCYIENK